MKAGTTWNEKLYRAGFLTVWLLGVIICGGLLLLCLCNRVVMPMNKQEQPVFLRQTVSFLVMVLLSLAALVFGGAWLQKLSERGLFWGLSAAWLVAGIYLIENVEPVLRADALAVYEAAAAFRAGDYSALDIGGYLFLYPHQLGLLAYENLLLRFGGDAGWLFLANLLLVLVTNYCLYRIADIWFGGNEMVNKYTILLSHLFLPQLFFILFAYGTIPGTALSALTLYRAGRFTQERTWKNGVLTVLPGALAILLRNNCLIVVIALALVFALSCLKQMDWRLLAMVGVLLLTLIVPQKLLYGYYAGVTDRQIPEGMPKILWVAMGMQESSRGAGWYNGYTDGQYRAVDYDADAAAFFGKIALESSIEKMKSEPSYGLNFFFRKVTSTWCEPTFQSLWSGPLADCGQETRTVWLQELYGGGRAYEVVTMICGVLLADLLALTFVFLLLTRRSAVIFPLYPVIYLIGGFLFHLIWETKAQYVSAYVLFLIPLAAGAVVMLRSRFSRRI